MVKLNDYLYSGDTVLKILYRYMDDLKISGEKTQNVIDLMHCEFLMQQIKILEHNAFLTSQSQRIREFYQYMAKEYPYLAFTFKGRIKSLIRAEEKFNGYVVAYIYNYYNEHGTYPEITDLQSKLSCFRDLIAYRIVISIPKCHIKEDQDQETEEIKCLYQISNHLLGFLEELGFVAEEAGMELKYDDSPLEETVRPYYRDYIANESPNGYRSLHITFYDKIAECYIEVQLRTKGMDDYAEIGPANHLGYEKRQEHERARRAEIPEGECIYFDEAYERVMLLQQLELDKIDVNMFAATDNSLINDGCGLFRGRSILPYEHLSRFQSI